MNETAKQSTMEELRAGYLHSLPNKHTTMVNALAARDFKGICRLAHQLKGSGLSYGYPQISDLAVRLEDAAENRRVPLLESLLIEFRDLMEHFSHQTLPSENA
jgi:HPt (histidine-containing phosphotransfer) domain-containing protein